MAIHVSYLLVCIFLCDILLIVTFITFFLKYHKTIPLLTPYTICTLSNLCTNAVCVLVYIPSLVGGAFVLAAV